VKNLRVNRRREPPSRTFVRIPFIPLEVLPPEDLEINRIVNTGQG
jgi:hypothetical protein